MKTIDIELIGKRIKEIREEKGLSQDKLADMLDTSQGTVSSWETGRCLPYTYSLIVLAEVLNVSLDYITGLKDKKH